MSGERLRIRIAKLLDARLGRLALRSAALLGMGPDQKRHPSACRRILFIKFWGIGSIVLSEPAVRRLRRLHPQAEIHYLTLERNRELFSMIEGVDCVHSLKLGSVAAFLVRWLAMLRKLRGQRFDLIVDAEFFSNFSMLTALAAGRGRRRIIGFAQPRSWKKRLLDQAIPFSRDCHTTLQFVRLASQDPRAAEGAAPRLVLSVRPDPPLLERPYIVVNINASDLAIERRWPRERFLRLTQTLLDRTEYEVALIGSNSEREYVAPLEKALQRPLRVRNLTGVLTLVQLAQLLRGARMLISNDSGPLHMAAALDVPVVGFYGPETPLRYGPAASRSLVFYSGLWCSPCMSVDNSKTVDCINAMACMKTIESESAGERILEFLNRLQAEPATGPARAAGVNSAVGS